jgi:hypothetical protein
MTCVVGMSRELVSKLVVSICLSSYHRASVSRDHAARTRVKEMALMPGGT